jgi:hypothetical protein
MMLICAKDGTLTVIQPNEDGSYWRKIVRNKMIRMKEKRREEAAAAFAAEEPELNNPEMPALKLASSWGPYTSMIGTAKSTSVKSLEQNAKVLTKK